MALLIDTPRWPAHDRLWAHLVSDTSLTELHAFADRAGLPARSFEGDHYDVPGERHAAVVAAGARLVQGRDIVKALQGSGLRLPKRKGERVLATWADPDWPPGSTGHRVDCLASTLPPPTATTTARWLLRLDDEGRLSLDGDRLPAARPTDDRCGFLRVRPSVRGAPWQHVALHQGGGPGAEPGRRLRHVPLDLVSGVTAQRYWWPLLMSVRHDRHDLVR